MNFEMRFLDRTILPDLIALQREVVAALPDPEIFMLHDEAYFSGIFDLPRAAIGVFSGDRLIAYCFIPFPAHLRPILAGISICLKKSSAVHYA